MKVGIMGSYPTDRRCIKGGIESSVYGLVQTLKNLCDVVVYDTPRNQRTDSVERDDNVQIYRHRNNGSWNFMTIKLVSKIVQEIQNENIDICHIHGNGLFEYTLYKELLKINIPTIITVHGLVHVEKKKALRQRYSIKLYLQYLYQSYFEFKLLSKCSKIIVDTEYVKDAINKYYSECKIKTQPQIHVIPQGINNVYFNLKCSNSSKKILSVGSISSRKGHLYLLGSFDKLCVNHNDLNLTIIGVKASNVYYQELKQYIEQSQNRDKIELLTNVDQDRLYSEYTQAHIFALHSEEESQGIVLAEAMATGLPVVSTNVGGIPYVVEDGVSGCLSKYTDINAFSENLSTLLLDDNKWKQMSENAIEQSKLYNWYHITEHICELYAELINVKSNL